MHFCFNALESSCSIRHVQTFLCFKGINGLLHTSSISLLIVSLLWCIKMIRHRSRTHDDLYTRNLTVINITNFRFLINDDICDVDNIVIVTTVFSGNRSDILNVQKNRIDIQHYKKNSIDVIFFIYLPIHLCLIWSETKNLEERDVIRWKSFLKNIFDSILYARKSWGNPDIPGVETRLVFLLGEEKCSIYLLSR